MNGPPIDPPMLLPHGMKLETPAEVAASARARARDKGAGDPVASLMNRIRLDPIAAWEPASARARRATLRGVDDLALQRVARWRSNALART
jgi:hypothetical protein